MLLSDAAEVEVDAAEVGASWDEKSWRLHAISPGDRSKVSIVAARYRMVRLDSCAPSPGACAKHGDLVLVS